MEITELVRAPLVNSLIETISELYEHDGDKDRPALAALLTRMTVAYQRSVRHVREADSRPARQLPEMTAYVRTPHFQRRAPANLRRSSRPQRRR